MEIQKFLDVLASNSPTPGGGGAAALAGSIGVALGSMVGSLTVGKVKYADVEAEILAINEEAEGIRYKLYDLIRKDAEAFEPLSKAYRIPKDDPKKDEIMEVALKEASLVPLEIMEQGCRALELLQIYAEKGSVLALSDAGCGAVMCRAAVESAALSVYINTKAMKDRELANSINEKTDYLVKEYGELAAKVYESVLRRLR